MTGSAGELFRRHGTSAVSDALDLLGHDGGLPGLARRSGTATVAGPAFTVGFAPVRPGEPAPAADYIDEVPPGSVVVIGNQGRTRCTVWGDLLTEVARRRGVAGTVIDGCCRDLEAIGRLGYPLWSMGAYMKSGKNRVRLAVARAPVEVRGVTVEPGDMVCADDSGVVVVPTRLVDRVAEGVRRVSAMEQRVRADIARGLPLREARARHGYDEVAIIDAAG